MASHYTDFCGKGKQRQYFVIINEHGEMIMSRLDENGKPISWCCGDVIPTITNMLRYEYPLADIQENQNCSIFRATGYVEDNLDNVISKLNGKSCTKKSILKWIFSNTNRLRGFVSFDGQDYSKVCDKKEKK